MHVFGGTSAFVGHVMLGRRSMRPANGGILPGLEQGEQSPARPYVAGLPQRQYAGGRDPKGGAGTPAQALSGHQVPKRCGSVDVELQDLAEQDQEETDLLKPAGGWPRRFENPDRDEVEFGAITYLQVAGMFSLWVGWYGFNAGSTLAMDGQAALAAGIIAWNTTMAAASGGFGAYLYCCIFHKHLDQGIVSNGVLTGLVAITASCDVATPGSAATVGFVGGLVVFPLASYCMKVMHLDDPVNAISLHMFGGLFGLLATAFCRPDCEMLAMYGGGHASQARFCLDGHDAGRQMVAQLWGAATELAFGGVSFALVWGLFAVSERTRAHEVELLAKAEQLLHQMVTPEPHEGAAAEWERIVSRSPLARHPPPARPRPRLLPAGRARRPLAVAAGAAAGARREGGDRPGEGGAGCLPRAGGPPMPAAARAGAAAAAHLPGRRALGPGHSRSGRRASVRRRARRAAPPGEGARGRGLHALAAEARGARADPAGEEPGSDPGGPHAGRPPRQLAQAAPTERARALPRGPGRQQQPGVLQRATQLRPEGFEFAQLHQAGFGATQPRQAGLESAQLHQASFGATQLDQVGFEFTQLHHAGVDASELHQAGFRLQAAAPSRPRFIAMQLR